MPVINREPEHIVQSENLKCLSKQTLAIIRQIVHTKSSPTVPRALGPLEFQVGPQNQSVKQTPDAQFKKLLAEKHTSLLKNKLNFNLPQGQ